VYRRARGNGRYALAARQLDNDAMKRRAGKGLLKKEKVLPLEDL
jgi:hypothetical protein